MAEQPSKGAAPLTNAQVPPTKGSANPTKAPENPATGTKNPAGGPAKPIECLVQSNGSGRQVPATVVKVEVVTDSDSDDEEAAAAPASVEVAELSAAASGYARGPSPAEASVLSLRQEQHHPAADRNGGSMQSPGGVAPALHASAAVVVVAPSSSGADVDEEHETASSDDGSSSSLDTDTADEPPMPDLEDVSTPREEPQVTNDDALASLRQRANAAKSEGNDRFAAKDWEGALRCYKEAMELLPDQEMLHNNCAMAHMKLKQHVEALRQASIALQLNPKYSKALLQRGQAKQWMNYLEVRPRGEILHGMVGRGGIVVCMRRASSS